MVHDLPKPQRQLRPVSRPVSRAFARDKRRWLPAVAAWLLLQASWTGVNAQAAGYVLGKDDLITIQVVHVPEITDKPIRIAADGSVTLPLVGRVQASGLSTIALQDALAKRFDN